MDDDTIAVFTVTSLLPGLSEKTKWSEPVPIEIKRDALPDSSRGITFGSAEYCSVVLPTHKSISKRHFSLTFDDKYRLVIRDHSTNGTEVKYGDQGAGLCLNRQWILNDQKLPHKFRQIKIGVADAMSFKVDVRLMMSSESSYGRVVERFRSLCEDMNTLENHMGTSSVEQTDAIHEPKHADPELAGDIWIDWQESNGTSASIKGCWNTGNGSAIVLKTALGNYDEKRWSRQVEFLTILKDHHHVVDITGQASPKQMEMEYLSGGSLEEPKDHSLVSEDSLEISDDHSEYSENCSEVPDELIKSKFTKEQATSILAQCLSVLVAMHERPEPICHRDIKPCNILINKWNSSGICVKIAGFGEASRVVEKDPGGGDAVYAPREFWSEKKRGPSEDIWLLGLTTLSLFKKGIQQLYCGNEREFWTEMGQSTDSLVQFLRRNMIRKKPEERSSAAECLKRLRELQAGDGIKPCGCFKHDPCVENVSECEDEGVKTPTMSNVQEESSNSSTPTQKKVADGQSQGTICSPAEESSIASTPTQTAGHLQGVVDNSSTPGGGDPSVNAGEGIDAPASPANVAPTDESRIPRAGKRQAEPGDELSNQKRHKL